MFLPPSRSPGGRAAATLVTASLLASLTPAFPVVSGQEISYTTVNRVEFGGTMGMMMRMVPDAQAETTETVYLKGALMRTDGGESSTIVDMDEGRYTFLQHEDKTYHTVTLAQMQEQMDQARQQMAEYPEAPMGGMPPGEEGGYEFRMSTDRTGETRRFDGYSADQVLITVEMIPQSPEAVEAAAMMGRVVMFTEMWISSDFPGAAALKQAQERMGEAFLEGGGAGMAGGMGQALMGNPGLKEAMERNWEEMKNMDGIPVRTVAHMVSVPTGMDFDPGAVLAAADQPLEAGEGISARDAAREALGRRMGGLLRRGQQEEPQAPEGPTTQTITMRSVSTIQGISTAAIADDLFRPPPDYTERPPEWGGGR